MNVEVMRAMDAAALFAADSRAAALTFPSSDISRCKGFPLPSGYPEFIASCMLQSIPTTQQEPWNANVLSFLHRIVDELLTEDGVSLDDNERREALMRPLCQHVFELKHWKTCPWWFSDLVSPSAYFSETTSTLEFNVMLANILLCRRTTLEDVDLASLMTEKSAIFGTLLDVSVKSDQGPLVALLLDNPSLDVKDSLLSQLHTAIRCADTHLLKTLLGPGYALYLPEEQMKTCIMQAIIESRTETAIYLLSANKQVAKSLGYELLQAACYHGNLAVVKALVDDFQLVGWKVFVAPFEHYPLQYIAFHGHIHILRYFFDKGVEREPRTMRAAAIRGDLPLARFLHEQGVSPDTADWINILRVAISHATPRHFAWTRAVLEEGFVDAEALLHERVSNLADLVAAACTYGDVELMRKLAAAGLDLNHVENLPDMPPMLMAQIAGHEEMVNALLEMGADPIDPLESSVAHMFASGEYPKVPKKRVTYEDGATDWFDRYSN
jgi:ankyrin repeat protein